MVHKVIVYLTVFGLFDSKSYGNCFVLAPFEKDVVKWPTLLPAVLLPLTWLSGPPWGHSPLVKRQEQGVKGSGQALKPSYPGVFQALKEPGKARTHWPHKTQALLFTEGHPISLGILVSSSRHWVQWDLLEGNLVLTPPLVRFIGRKSGTHRINRRQKEQVWKRARPREPRPWSSGVVWPGCQTPLHVAPR